MPRTKIPHNVVNSVLIEAGYRCAVPTCRNILAIDMHHIVEVKDGGPNEPSNLLALCPTCHALYTRGTIPKEAINAWKTMLVALNHAFDQESISNLLFLHILGQESENRVSRIRNDEEKFKSHERDGQIVELISYDGAISDLNLLLISGDGVLKFSHLISSGLAFFYVAVELGATILYSVQLTQKGMQIIDAWFSGNRQNVQEALNYLPSN